MEIIYENYLEIEKLLEMLNHRQGTPYEDIAVIDPRTGKTLIRKDGSTELEIVLNKHQRQAIKDNPKGSQIVMHNHPHNSVPSIQDIRQCANLGYKYGVVVCHNGDIFAYAITKETENLNMEFIDRQFLRLETAIREGKLDEDPKLWNSIYAEVKEAGVELKYV